MKTLLTIAFCSFLMAAQAQVTFTEYQIPANTDAENYRLVVDYFSDKQILLPVKQSGKVYAKNTANGSFAEITEGLFITAFYANNGDLYLVKNANTSGHEPHLYKSVDNGKTLVEITGVAGRLFQRDQFGNLYYSVPGGFNYSIDNGKTFTTVPTAKEAFSAARNTSGKLYYTNDKSELFSTVNNGSTWEDISKLNAYSDKRENNLWWKNDTLYFHSNVYFSYSTENATKWKTILFGGNTTLLNVCLSPDNVFYITSPTSLISSLAPATNNWKLLFSSDDFSMGFRGNETIYNNHISIANKTMYFNIFNSTNSKNKYGILLAPRTPIVISTVETVREQQFSIFPNPASERIQIRNESAKGEFRIYNIQGKLVLNETITEPAQTINIIPLKPGVYVWEMEKSKGKLVIQ